MNKYMKHDLISIVIPVYNAGKYISKCAESIFNQTYPNVEFVFVEDCSPDNTWQMLQELKSTHKDKNIILYRNEHNLGAGATRNKGLELASGKYVYFADADDELDSNLLQKAYDKLEADQSDFVYIAYKHIIDNKTYFNPIYEPALHAKSIEQIKNYAQSLFSSPWSKIIRSSFLHENSIYFPNTRSGEDYCWSLHMVLCAQKISFINEYLYTYIQTSNSLSTGYDSALCIFKNLDYANCLLAQMKGPTSLKKRFYDGFISAYCTYCKNLSYEDRISLINEFLKKNHPQLVKQRLQEFSLWERKPFYRIIPKFLNSAKRKLLKERYNIYKTYQYALSTVDQ